MNRARVAAVCVAVTLALCAGLIAGPRLLLGSRPTEETARVRLTQVTLGTIEQTLSLSGRLRGMQEFSGLAPENGRVAAVFVRAGEHVHAGDVLFRMDTTAQEQALAEALQQQARLADPVTQAWSRLAQETAMQETSFAAPLETQVQATRLLLAQSTVRAPADGVVAQVMLPALSTVPIGTPIVLLCSEEEQVLCSAVVRDASQVLPGMRARLSALGQALGEGVVTEVSPASVDQTTGQTVCQVTIVPDQAVDLPLGALVDAEIILYHCDDVPVLPASAVQDEQHVWWAASGRCYQLPVTVIASDERSCWVDLDVGVEVVDGAASLTEGQRIKELKP